MDTIAGSVASSTPQQKVRLEPHMKHLEGPHPIKPIDVKDCNMAWTASWDQPGTRSCHKSFAARLPRQAVSPTQERSDL